MMINFSKFTHLLDLWTKPKDVFINDEVPEGISEPKNVCPKCSSDTGFRTNDSKILEYWGCKICNAVWMTINENPND